MYVARHFGSIGVECRPVIVLCVNEKDGRPMDERIINANVSVSDTPIDRSLLIQALLSSLHAVMEHGPSEEYPNSDAEGEIIANGENDHEHTR